MHIQPSYTRLYVETIAMVKEIEAKRQRGIVDRISELPDFILHNILKIIGAKEACCASVLSKRWYGAWSSIPVLDFQPYWNNLFGDDDEFDFDRVPRYVEFIDKTMQRYLRHGYRITKLFLVFVDKASTKRVKRLVDKWIEIAVLNQIQELVVHFEVEYMSCYKVPEILFRAKSLKVLKLVNVVVPYYETMDLISLDCFTLVQESVDEDMLQRIISFCPLVKLDITSADLGKISLPWTRKVNKRDECFGSGTLQLQPILKASPIRKFVYNGLCSDLSWPWKMNVGALKNLRQLKIICATITDDIVSELAYGLVALDSLVLAGCWMLKCIKISSISLKEFRIVACSELMKATVDAPNLLKFWYNCDMEASLSLIRAQDHCYAHFFPLVNSITISTVWFIKLKKFLIETNFFQSLVMDLSESNQIVVEVDQLRNVATGPPYKLRELTLLNSSSWAFTQYPPTAFLDGLFFICHPDVLSMKASFQNWSAEPILNILKRKVKCWNHPLTSIEVEGVDYTSLLSEPSAFEIRFRLSWSSVY